MSDLVKLKRLFFTEANVIKTLGRKRARALSRFGAATRAFAQRSMRPRKGKSPAGIPPYAHNRKLLRKLLFFAFDGSSSVVVGPILKPSTRNIGIPKAHEKGGVIAGKNGVARYPARPYMEPAGAKYLPKIKEWYASA